METGVLGSSTMILRIDLGEVMSATEYNDYNTCEEAAHRKAIPPFFRGIKGRERILTRSRTARVASVS